MSSIPIILQYVGAAYLISSTLGNVLPKGWRLTKFFVTLSADLRGLIPTPPPPPPPPGPPPPVA